MGSANARNDPQGSAHLFCQPQSGSWGNPCLSAAQTPDDPDAMIGCSQAFLAILDTVRSVAKRRCCITITGETGTGKEMVARKIHQFSDRNEKAFIPVDCTTLTGQLFESQLFGHVKGAFTGAIDNTLGFFRAADGGTIFFDEISEIPLELQAKLLRVLQQGAVTPLGSTRSHTVDVRVLCATNRDLRQMVSENEFRADLYYRLNVVNLLVPPLRQRLEDILPLALFFLKNLSAFYSEPLKWLAPQTERIIMQYPWPGNIRQLANALERAYVLSEKAVIAPAALPPEVLLEKLYPVNGSELPTIEQAKEKLVAEALKRTRGNKSAAAKILGIERRRLNRLIEKLNVSASKLKH